MPAPLELAVHDITPPSTRVNGPNCENENSRLSSPCYQDEQHNLQYPNFSKLLLASTMALASNAEAERRFSEANSIFFEKKNMRKNVNSRRTP